MKSYLKCIQIMCTLLVGIAPGVTAAAQDYEVFSFNSTIEPSVETFNIAQYGTIVIYGNDVLFPPYICI